MGRQLFGCLLACCQFLWSGFSITQATDFTTEIVPIIEQHCIRCHSPGNIKGEISLATITHLQEKEYIVPGDAESSYLIDLVTSNDGQPPEMPQESDPLSDEEVDVLRRWINAGADWPADIVIREKSKADASWWAYQPLKNSTGTIDDFIRHQLAQRNLEMNPEADRRALIRRATYDLTGLPPTPEEVIDFMHDPDPLAYEKLIERLLASPRYGERWGRHWLDVVRFGESNGFERNVIINDLWPFRDYVIESINNDKPFDQLMKEHIAGDVIGKDDPQVAVGSAFLVAGPYDDVGNQDAVQAAQIRANTLDEIINATGEAFLGMTLGCARCHDHKFDPITQEDYYAWYATFAGVRHGRVALASAEEQSARNSQVQPLQARQAELTRELESWTRKLLEQGRANSETHQKKWVRSQVDRTGTIEQFKPVIAKFVRFTCEASDLDFHSRLFRIDEFEVWSTGVDSRNVALQSLGGKATGKAREIKDFPNAYGPQLVNDGQSGARFISAGPDLTIELAEPTEIDRIVFSSARGETTPEHQKFSFVAEYRIEVSLDGNKWEEVASGRDRQPRESRLPGFRQQPDLTAVNSHLDYRLLQAEMTPEAIARKAETEQELTRVTRQLAAIPPLRQVWIGTRNPDDAQGPFHVFLGGSPQKKGGPVVPASLSVLNSCSTYQLAAETPEAERRLALAEWIVHPDNPLTPRVLVNRIWQYHFGTGLVDTPSDFGYMGGRPSHPELLDFLAIKLKENNWQIKNLHRQMMLSATYRQSSNYRIDAAEIDGDSRLLWRFPPRRLSSEEIRDSMLMIAGQLNLQPGGPGFRLYEFQQDNVCTYVPLDQHGPETYRRAVYHQNARASVVDLMTEFDQPDCSFSIPRRSETTTPLQALTMLNHSFTLDMAGALSQRLLVEAGNQPAAQVRRAYQLCYAREPHEHELKVCLEFLSGENLKALCRVLFNTSELIYVQ